MENIRGLQENTDKFYRYKMPTVIIIKQRNNNAITNINDVAKSLDRNPEMLITFMKKRLSIAMKYQDAKIEYKGVEDDKIKNTIYEFIEKCVLCKACKNPETELTENGNMKCKACSFKSKLG